MDESTPNLTINSAKWAKRCTAQRFARGGRETPKSISE